MRVIRSNTIVTTGTQRAISACLQNNILFRRLCAFYVQSFFCGKANLKNINQERSRKIPPVTAFLLLFSIPSARLSELL